VVVDIVEEGLKGLKGDKGWDGKGLLGKLKSQGKTWIPSRLVVGS
jgi:hypothetical protein